MKPKAFLAEFIGTFGLIFIGVGAIASDAIIGGRSGLVGVALAHGFTIAIMASATMAISGGHLNPAVTIGALVAQKIDWKNAIGYVLAQCLGAIVAAALLKVCLPETVLGPIKMGTPMVINGLAPHLAALIEAILTFFLVFVIFGTAVDNRAHRMGGLFIGLAITADILVGGPLTGAAMNPARHLGPALLGGGFTNMWVYWVGPIVGAVAAALVYRFGLEK